MPTRLRQLRKSRGLNQNALADIFNVSQNAVSCWETGERRPDTDTLCKLAQFFGCTVDYFLGISDSQTSSGQIPVLGYVRAGAPITAVENIIGYEEISNNMSSLGEHFGLKIRGDSMEPRIQEDSVVIVRKQATANNGDVVIAFVGDSDVTVKQFFKTETGIKLVPFNTSYDVMEFSYDQVNTMPVTLLGKVVEMRVKF